MIANPAQLTPAQTLLPILALLCVIRITQGVALGADCGLPFSGRSNLLPSFCRITDNCFLSDNPYKLNKE